MTTILDDEWIGLHDLCKIADWTIGTVHNKLSRGEDLPRHFKIGKNIRFRKSDVESWLLKRARVPAATQLAEARA